MAEFGIDPGKYVVVRTYSAGVHCGVLEARLGREVVLADARTLTSWNLDGIHGHVSNVAAVGPVRGVATKPVPRLVVTEAIAVMETTAQAEKRLRAL